MGHGDLNMRRTMRRPAPVAPEGAKSGSVLLFGALAGEGKKEAARSAAPNLEARTLNDRIPGEFEGYRLRMRWLQDRYQSLRNAAWLVRNSRTGQQNNPLALRVVLVEAEKLLRSGEPMYDVLEAFAELLVRP